MGLEKWLEKKLPRREPESKGEPLVLKMRPQGYQEYQRGEEKTKREKLISQVREEAAKPKHQTLASLIGIGQGLKTTTQKSGKRIGQISGGIGDISTRIGTGMNVMEKKFFEPSFFTQEEISFGKMWSPPKKPKPKGKAIHIYVHTEGNRKKRRK